MNQDTHDNRREWDEEILLGLGGGVLAGNLRASMLAESTRRLRRRNRLRRVRMIAALAACYLAGVASAWFPMAGVHDSGVANSGTAVHEPIHQVAAAPGPESTSSDAAADLVQVELDPVSEDSPAPVAIPDSRDADRLTRAPAVLLERWASSVAPKDRATMYRRAGDRYLQESGDIASATRCYGRALDHGLDEERTTWAAHDNWLMMALKQARQREASHGKHEG